MMQKWKYTYVHLAPRGHDDYDWSTFWQQLELRGQEGWEAVGFFKMDVGGAIVLLKLPIG